MFDINMYNLSDLPNKVSYCNWRTGIVKMNSLTTIILSILFPLALWATIEIPSNRPHKFSIAVATGKRTPCKYINSFFIVVKISILKLLRKLEVVYDLFFTAEFESFK